MCGHQVDWKLLHAADQGACIHWRSVGEGGQDKTQTLSGGGRDAW